MRPDAGSQVEFLQNLQRLLNEGEFTATYKYALLLALADMSVEGGDDSGSAFRVGADQLAEKFIDYYWRHTIPYPSKRGDPAVLRQNSKGQAEVVKILADARARVRSGRALKLCDRHRWELTRGRVARNIQRNPLWRLQVVAGVQENFLYENVGEGAEIELRPGVAFCFRRFYGLISDLVRGAWLRRVRMYNAELLDDVSDLHAFLFGAERVNLSPVRPVLMDLQAGKCFYCGGGLRGPGAVDHFIAWSRYPVDLGHNFVLAHSSCNSSKGDHLAALEHLERWAERNALYGGDLRAAFEEAEVPSDPRISRQVAHWAYSQGGDGMRTWAERNSFVPLPRDWVRALDAVR